MKTIVLLILLLAGILPLQAEAAEPQLSVCQAVQLAEKHLQEKGVDRSGQHIQNVRRQYDAERRMGYWEIIWAWDSARVGMELSARVYPDGRVEWRRLGP